VRALYVERVAQRKCFDFGFRDVQLFD